MARNTRYQPFLVLGFYLLLSGFGILILFLAGKFRVWLWSQTLMDQFTVFELSLLFATLPITIIAIWSYFRRRWVGPLPILVSVFLLGPILGTIAIEPLVMVAYHPEMSYWSALVDYASLGGVRQLYYEFSISSAASAMAGMYAILSVLAASLFLQSGWVS